MSIKKPILFIFFPIMLISAVIVLAIPGSILGQATIPTRTPVSTPEDPTDPPPEPTDDDGGDNNTPSPTNPPNQNTATPTRRPNNTPLPATQTGVPRVTASATQSFSGSPTATVDEPASPIATVKASATPLQAKLAPGTTPVAFPVVATAYPTAEICGEPPTFTTLVQARAFSGPGEDYDLLETLKIDETRPIVGRAIYSSWWLIQLNGKYYQAWVEDSAGIIEGDTENVIEVEAPEIDGIVPTPGVRWNPTPVYFCDLTPTPTTSEEDEQIVSGVIDVDSNNSEEQSTGSSTDQAINETAMPLDIPSSSSTPNLLPIAGLVLIIAAVFVALFLRRNPGGDEPSP
ncbi:MAG: hypothetical protein R3293_05450 [Candidatus Promineifilaceae bacterium]|nr:hypothetical protein [Candidatus Promineifilaceae bacterium]